MRRILVTGATGNIGAEVIHFLNNGNAEAGTIAAVRNIGRAKKQFNDYPGLAYREFDFEDQSTFRSAFENIDILFLLRPPHISQVEKYFQPLLHSAKVSGIHKIVFLSVQGAEKSKVIPHNQIERLVKSYGFQYIFVRPSYFMQNLTTTLLPDIQANREITLPAGQAKFNWIDVKNIGELSAILISSFDAHQKNAFEITGTENKSFKEVAALISELAGIKIGYTSINPISFYFRKRREGLESNFAIVMTILHFLPRFQKEPEISDNFKRFTGRNPTTLNEFIEREKDKIRYSTSK